MAYLIIKPAYYHISLRPGLLSSTDTLWATDRVSHGHGQLELSEGAVAVVAIACLLLSTSVTYDLTVLLCCYNCPTIVRQYLL